MSITTKSVAWALLLTTWLFAPLAAQDTTRYNLGMDRVLEDAELPEGWDTIGSYSFSVESDPSAKSNKFITIQSNENTRFGVIRYFIPAKNAGTKLTLTAKVKLEDVDSQSQANLRIVFFRGRRQISVKATPALTDTSDWQDYSVSIASPQGADRFAVIGVLTGKGSASFDDFRVASKDSPVAEFKANWASLFPAYSDKEFDNGSGIAEIPINDEAVVALDLLGRVWGHIKYHHPTIAAGKKNWDYELFRILPKYLAANSKEDQAALLIQWIDGIGEFEAESSDVDKDVHSKLKPDVEWIDGLASSQLGNRLKLAQSAKRPPDHFYVGFVENVRNPIFHEEQYSQFEYPDAGFRLLALYRHWNIIQYYFPYRSLTDKNWNDVLGEFIPRFVNAKDALDYRLATMELISSVQDTHAQFFGPDKFVSEYLGLKIGALQLRFIGGKLTVVGFVDEEAVDKNAVRVGDVVTSIDGVKVTDWIKDRGRYYWASNEPTRMRQIAQNILRTNKDQLSLRLRRGQEDYSTTIKSMGRQRYGQLIANLNKARESWKVIDDDIAYLYPGSLTQDDVRQGTIARQLRDKKGLVIDLRCYPSQFIVFSVGAHLVPEPTDFVTFTTPGAMPGAFEFSNGPQIGRKNPRFFAGKVAILIDERSQSQSEYTAMAMRVAPRARVFGGTTAGADGNLSFFVLPGNIRTAISGIGVYTPEGKDTQRIGIVPDVRVEPTVEGIRSGQDEVLEAALEWIGNEGE